MSFFQTRTVYSPNIIGLSSAFWIRPMRIEFSASDMKPNTIMYPFFGGINVRQYINGGFLASTVPLKTDSNGSIYGTFDIPAFTFPVGPTEFKLQENPVYERDGQTSSVFGSAAAMFNTNKVSNTLKETVKTFNNTSFFLNSNLNITGPASTVETQEPLAQSFFTYGVTGGCFITGIDLYFQSKDLFLPIRVEIREMSNGFPGKNLASPYSFVSLTPNFVETSTNGSVPTFFRFPSPIYLPENRDWCFVISSNSGDYNIWTSKIGEKSQETGKTIFEQPYVGSLYKSENNITWKAEQAEDIKFKLYKAKFDITNSASISLKVNTPPQLISGKNIFAVSGSAEITVKFLNQHGLRTNDYIGITAQTGATYRGIPAANITSTTNSDFPVTVLDDYTVKFVAKSVASSTGALDNNGIVNKVSVESSGSGYPTGTTITFSDPPAGGTRAEATVVLLNGAIVDINITNRGAGYTSAPSYTLSFIPANPAVLNVVSDSTFEVTVNKLAHGYKPVITSSVPPDTQLTTRIKTTDSDYQIGNFKLTRLNYFNFEDKSSIVLSQKNNAAYLPNQAPTEVNLLLSSTNENTSPILAFNEQKKLQTFAYIINNFPSYDEVILEDKVYYVLVNNGGTGYTQGTAVVFSAPNDPNGTLATGFINVDGAGAITSVDITEQGSGYTTAPTITVAGGTNAVLIPYGFPVTGDLNTIYHKPITGKDWIYNGTTWTEVLNSEFKPTGGGAYSKYITKQFTLETISKGARVFVTAASMLESSFDVYIRTSLSSTGSNHRNLRWKKMKCDVARNLSKKIDEFLDYTFYLDDISEFDVYDLKIVMLSGNKTVVPRISNYRTIILAT